MTVDRKKTAPCDHCPHRRNQHKQAEKGTWSGAICQERLCRCHGFEYRFRGSQGGIKHQDWRAQILDPDPYKLSDVEATRS